MSLNLITIMGRLVRDPEQRYTVTGKSVTSLTLAVDRNFKSKNENEQTADFISVVAWGKTGENIAKYIKKGNRLLVSGRLQTRDYINKNNEKRKITEVVAQRVQFIDHPNNNPVSEGAQTPASPSENINSFDTFGDETHPF